MRLLETSVQHGPGTVRVVAPIERDGRRLEAYLEFPAAYESFLGPRADAFLPALLLPCLETGEDLEIAEPVSPALLSRVGRVQEVLLAMHQGAFRPARVLARPRREAIDAPRPAAVASLFSGGVDSFYTLLKWDQPDDPADRITHLVFVKGLEQPLDQSRGTDESLQRVREVAAETGRQVITGETNLRSLFTLDYQLYYHGAALVSAVLALSGGLRRLLVPASFSYGQIEPWGTHPCLDHLWSTERLEVLHDGCEARRVDKISGRVGRHPLALRHLRVCLENAGGPDNCGRCRKCARTMFALALLGTLESARTFPPASPQRLARALARDDEPFVVELLDLARRSGPPALARLVEGALRRRRRRVAIKTLLETTPGLDAVLPAMLGVRRRVRRALARSPRPLATHGGALLRQ